MVKKSSTVTLYDAGGLILVWLFFGLPLGVIFEYIWNLIVLLVALPWLLRNTGTNPGMVTVSKGKRAVYCLFITALGIVIDWAYFEMTWDMGLSKTQVWYPAMGQVLQLLLILVPMTMLWLVNFALSYSYLRVARRQAMIFGGIMAFFTAPWLLPIIPYVFGWTA
jgi:hypothetical protein